MEWKDILKPRHIITLSAIILVSIMAVTGTIEGKLAATIIIGVLVSYGTYQAPSPRQKEQ